jgi:AcrR family transcriptional regulator
VARHATGVYAGVPAEQRRADRGERLLEAALESLGTQGWQATSVRGICEQASLNARYFYESFSGLDELLIAVFDRIVDDTVQSILDALQQAPATAKDQALAVVAAFVHTTTDDPRKARVAFIEAFGTEALMRRRLDRLQDFADLVAALALQLHQVDGLTPTDAAINAQMISGGLIEAIIAWLEGRLNIDRDKLIEHCAKLIVTAAGVT